MIEREPKLIDRVAITGLGTINSLGVDAPTSWDAMLQGKSGIINYREQLQQLAPNYSYLNTHLAAPNAPFRLLDDSAFEAKGWDEKFLRRFVSYAGELALKMIAEAVRDAQIADDDLVITETELNRLGFVIGSGGGGSPYIGELQRDMDADKRLGSTAMFKSLPDNPHIVASMFYDATGPSRGAPKACASGNAALLQGVQILNNNEADVIVAGGVDGLSIVTVASFENTRASYLEDDTSIASLAGHQKTGGAILGSGGGVLVLEREDFAKARGAKIRGYITGYAETNGAQDPTLLSIPQLVEAGRLALMRAGGSGEKRFHVNAHLTGTKKGDKAEAVALDKLKEKAEEEELGQMNDVSGFKLNTGHSAGGAGGVEGALSVLALEQDILPPTVREDEKASEVEVTEGLEELMPVTDRSRPLNVDTILSMNSGFGDQNVAIVFEKAA